MSGTVIRVVVTLVSVVFLIGTWVTTGTPNTSILTFFSTAVFVVTLAFLAWEKWLWKMNWVQRLPKVTRDVSGTWEALLTSMWKNPDTGQGIDPKVVYLVVRQTASNVSVTLISNESKSKSTLARIVLEDGSWTLHYVYTNEPAVDLRHRSPIHHGSGVLSVVGRPAQRLAGSYWTDRESKGLLELRRRSKHHAEDFQGAVALFDHN